MAKQLGIIQFSGKLGQTVGMRKSSLQSRNSMRLLVSPSNPRTEAQAKQRMKMNTALKIYRAAEPILSRAFENKKYGTQSRQFFMSQLMSKQFTENGWWLPYETKGDFRAIPGAIPVSIGSLSVDTTLGTVTTQGANCPLLDIDVTEACSTFGALCTQLVNAGKGLQNGDQITVILVRDIGSDGGESGVSYIWDSIVIDVNSTAVITTIASGANVKFVGQRGLIEFGDSLKFVSGYDVAAAAIIVSRDRNANYGKAGLRSTSIMRCNISIQQAWLSDAAYNAALDSYMSAESAGNSDWPYDASADTGGSSATVDETVKEANITAGAETYSNVAYCTIDGVKYVPYHYVTEDSDSVIKAYKRASDMAFTATGGASLGLSAGEEDAVADFAAAGYTLIKQTVFHSQHPDYTFS